MHAVWMCMCMTAPCCLQIGEVWRQHVASIGRDKTGALAVHTYYLFGRLFLVLRHQFSMLTREACNYLGETYHSVASHFLVTVELLLSQLELPKVYVDSELVSVFLWDWCGPMSACDAHCSLPRPDWLTHMCF